MKKSVIEDVVSLLTDIAEDNKKCANAKIAAAVITKNREIVSIATNVKKSHPFQKKYSKNHDSIFLHAETHAIYRAIKKIGYKALSDCTLVIVRVKYNHKGNLMYGLAKPCIGCMRCIVEFNLRNVYYTLDTEDLICKVESLRE